MGLGFHPIHGVRSESTGSKDSDWENFAGTTMILGFWFRGNIERENFMFSIAYVDKSRLHTCHWELQSRGPRGYERKYGKKRSKFN